MAFYGIPEEDRKKVMEHTLAIIEIYQRNNQTVLNADNMLLAMRSTRFMSDADFNEAIQLYCHDADGVLLNNNITKFWRLHVYTWCCEQALKLDGDLVECGVHMGLYSLVMMKTLKFANSGRNMVLYDTFEGLSEEFSSAGERALVAGVYDIPDWEKQVRESFSVYQNASVIKGNVPEVLADTAPDRVSFLHLDMNAASAEIAALEFFWPRLVPGAIILLDDYGRAENLEIGEAHETWFGDKGMKILELPTGQGFVLNNQTGATS